MAEMLISFLVLYAAFKVLAFFLKIFGKAVGIIIGIIASVFLGTIMLSALSLGILLWPLMLIGLIGGIKKLCS